MKLNTTQRLHILMKWVLRKYFGSSQVYQDSYLHFVKIWNRYESKCGTVWTVKRFKLIRLGVTKYLAGQVLTPTECLGMTKDGLPKALGPMKDLIRSRDPQNIRFVLTILYVGRAYRPKEVSGFNQATVRDLSRADANVVTQITDFIQHNVLNKSSVMAFDPNWDQFHFTEKAGPAGHALLTSITNLRSLPKELLNDIITLGGERLEEAIEKVLATNPVVLDYLDYHNAKGDRRDKIRAISLKPDREMKVRPFALLDYWSQTCLKPVHDNLFEILKRIKTDHTFDHGKAIQAVKNLKPNGSYHSLDLSSATDRFPMELQHNLMKLLIGETKANAWRRILTGYEFEVFQTGDKLQYGAGQPMGAYSSWAVFTVCHHIVIWYCAGSTAYSNYAIIGDDVVIADDDVADRYVEVIKALGVDISPSKSHVSKDTFEIAKRWSFKGTEVTPFPIDGLSVIFNKPDILYLFLLEQEKKGYIAKGGIESASSISSLLQLFGLPERKIRSAAKLYRMIALFPFIGNRQGDYKDPKGFYHLLGFPVSCNVSNDIYMNELKAFAGRAIFNQVGGRKGKIWKAATYGFSVEFLSNWLVVAPGFGPHESNQEASLYHLPQVGSMLSLSRNLQAEFNEVRMMEIDENWDYFLNRKVSILISDPVIVFSGDRSLEVLGTQAQIVRWAVEGIKSGYQTRIDELNAPSEESFQDDSGISDSGVIML
uniref:RNA-dependent RNA polymerase n=1 Tax=Entomophthora muscae mitovirus 3 TaxID=2557976 RepID=A0A4D6PCY2_9VIRU|nr:RNA-dependent RNA polymerase [Entomophthora muscae mitovirus 3]